MAVAGLLLVSAAVAGLLAEALLLVPAAVAALLTKPAAAKATTTAVRRGVNVLLDHAHGFGALRRGTVHFGDVVDAVHLDASAGLGLDATNIFPAAADDAPLLTFARDAFLSLIHI